MFRRGRSTVTESHCVVGSGQRTCRHGNSAIQEKCSSRVAQANPRRSISSLVVGTCGIELGVIPASV